VLCRNRSGDGGRPLVSAETLPDPPGYCTGFPTGGSDARENNPDLIEKVKTASGKCILRLNVCFW